MDEISKSTEQVYEKPETKKHGAMNTVQVSYKYYDLYYTSLYYKLYYSRTTLYYKLYLYYVKLYYYY